MIPSLANTHAPDRERAQFTGGSNMAELADPGDERSLVDMADDDQAEELIPIAEDDDLEESEGEGEGAASLDEASLLLELRSCETIGSQYTLNNLAPRWQRSYQAYRNRHHANSKYVSKDFDHRSSVFKPKTRSAVRKTMAATAAALFATQDVLKLSASDESNKAQVASAMLKQELVNYRLSRSSGRNGVPWFPIAMGACQTAQITGCCISEQYWKFEQRPDTMGWAEWRHPQTGERYKHRVKKPGKIVFDRPEIDLHPNENVIIDPAAHWLDPAQSAGYIIFRIPTTVDGIMGMMRAGSDKNSKVKWRDDITEADIKAFAQPASSDRTEAKSTRTAREGEKTDRLDPATTGNTRYATVWLYKAYMKIDGQSYVFWSIGTNKLLSTPQLVEEVYPEYDGERPIVIGFGALEAFTPFPMSAVESLQPLQQEANDIVNLRLDQMKEVVNPKKLVKRGRNVDLTTLNRVGANQTVLVTDKEDVTWDRPPDVPQSAYAEAEYINNDFDDLAGAFNSSSVASNRKLNETVGGMKLLAGAAGSVTQFDLRVWIETWVEPVLRQIVKLEEYWESDENVLAICGAKAQLFEKHGINEITDKMLFQDSTLRVDAGIGMGAPDPMENLQKIGAATDIAGKMLEPFLANGTAKLKPKENGREIINYAFAAAGLRDGGDRFFDFPNPNDPAANQPPVDPRAAAEAAKTQAETAKIQQAIEAEKQKNAVKAAEDQRKLAVADEQLQQAKIKTQIALDEAEVARLKHTLDKSMKLTDHSMKAAEQEHQGKDIQLRQAEGALSFTERRRQAALAEATAQDARRGQAADREEGIKDKLVAREMSMQDHQQGLKQKDEAHKQAVSQKGEAHEQSVAAAKTDLTQKVDAHKQDRQIKQESHADEIKARQETRQEDGADRETDRKHKAEDHGLDMKAKKAKEAEAAKKKEDHDKEQDGELKRLRSELDKAAREIARLKKAKG